jgi:predicted GIY-YIG superfamily endonuclease
MLRKNEYVVYRYYDKDDVCLYIGYTQWMWVRDQGHRSDKKSLEWYPRACTIRFERYPDARKAKKAESEAIWAEQPIYNIEWKDKIQTKKGLKFVKPKKARQLREAGVKLATPPCYQNDELNGV